jgi:hypothetical protein
MLAGTKVAKKLDVCFDNGALYGEMLTLTAKHQQFKILYTI